MNHNQMDNETTTFQVGGRYNWKNQSDRLIYLGHNWSGNGSWHQFAKVGAPDVVWCEVLTSELHMLEETVKPKFTRNQLKKQRRKAK